MTEKFCKDCRYFQTGWSGGGFHQPATCHHPKSLEPVHGNGTDCVIARNPHHGKCGARGDMWEARPPARDFVQRLFGNWEWR